MPISAKVDLKNVTPKLYLLYKDDYTLAALDANQYPACQIHINQWILMTLFSKIVLGLSFSYEFDTTLHLPEQPIHKQTKKVAFISTSAQDRMLLFELFKSVLYVPIVTDNQVIQANSGVKILPAAVVQQDVNKAKKTMRQTQRVCAQMESDLAISFLNLDHLRRIFSSSRSSVNVMLYLVQQPSVTDPVSI
ncbi:hypothetical protein G6F37_010938 [Rhizopus arrhizus]|nr:hypothetical protein G6F38_005640 [Rhizopus arrhizus]KAG1151695.1 hypothetical protein G6F37_010938 [Rhizopus arrhizus]